MLNEALLRKLVEKPTILPRAVEVVEAVLTDKSYRVEFAAETNRKYFTDFHILCKRMEGEL